MATVEGEVSPELREGAERLRRHLLEHPPQLTLLPEVSHPLAARCRMAMLFLQAVDQPEWSEHFTEDLLYVYPGPEWYPRSGEFRGREGLVQFFDALIECVWGRGGAVTSLDERAWLVSDDGRHVTCLSGGWLEKGDQRVYESAAMAFELAEDGRICAIREHIDTGVQMELLGFTARTG
jgi:ketosteroid isomerase-like protein